MESWINPSAAGIEISGIRKFHNLVSNCKDAISLTIGQPDFNTPDHIKNAAINAINCNKTTYTHNAGLIELRYAISSYIKSKYELSYNPETEIIVTCGASEAIDAALRAILSPGSEVILPAPAYPGYEPIIKLCSAVPVLVDTSSSNFILTAELIEKNITAKTRCIILPYPSNPTGVVMPSEELKRISDLIASKNIFILSDEIYSEIIFSQKHNSIAKYEQIRDKVIVVNGLSKSHSMTGWRIGFLFAPENIAKHILKVHQYNVTCASTISQYAALEAVTAGYNDPVPMKNEFQKRRDFVYEYLCRIGFDVIKPEGAFYIFPSIKKFKLSSFDFAVRLLYEAGVAVVPGDAFSKYGEGYIRISYACSMEVLESALKKTDQFVSSLKNDI